VKKLVAIVGARPQFIKAAAFSRIWREELGHVEILVHTGQHYDENMSDVFFRELRIPTPEVTLGVGSGDHGAQTGRMLEAIENVLKSEKPDAVLVYGDTNSTLAGALAAAKLHIPVAHIEAGLRSYNRAMPEEINRVLTDHMSDLLLVPTQTAVENLRREGLSERGIHHVGDVMYDIALLATPLAEQHSRKVEELGLKSGGYVLATIHRAENTDDPDRLTAIFQALCLAARQWPVVLPVHPRTRKALSGLNIPLEGLVLIDPVGYLDMLSLTRHARTVVTDSGGLQKEAYFHHVPCITLRGETEWVELVSAGWNRLMPPENNPQLAESLFSSIEAATKGLPLWQSLYGDGNAARLCAQLLADAD
jgi:UDP-GlcNAc3NAcA epimerase